MSFLVLRAYLEPIPVDLYLAHGDFAFVPSAELPLRKAASHPSVEEKVCGLGPRQAHTRASNPM
jgi:hypothetical protein